MPEPTEELFDREWQLDNLYSSEEGRYLEWCLDSYVRNVKRLLPNDLPGTQPTWSYSDYEYGNLHRSREPEYSTLLLFNVADLSKPHIKCVMHNDLDGDDSRLFRGEILTVIRIMLGQLKMRVFVDDMVAPVLLFSLNRLHPRVIEAYFDGQELFMRHTKPYDFTFLNAAGFKTFARWLMGPPIGDTSRNAVRT